MKNKIDILLKKKEHPVIDILQTIRSDYVKNRYVFISGIKMKNILYYFGATDDDLLELEFSGNFLGKDPTLPFRESRNGRFLIDFEENYITRLEFQPFVLSVEEDFKRSDSGIYRFFRGIQDNIQKNRAFQGLIIFQSIILEGIDILKRPNLVDNWNRWVSTIFQLRTLTTPALVGEPAQEGVHSDGVEHTMTTFLFSKNMTEDSAITHIHDKNQKLGISHSETDEKHIVGSFQHKHFLDTILIVDSEYQHSLSPVMSLDAEKNAIRDMIILFTRRPKSKNHSTYKNDTLNFHEEIPLNFSIL